MLTPQELDAVPTALVTLYGDVEQDILADMARRISAQNYFIPSAQWQYKKLLEMANTHEWILQKLSEKSKKTADEISSMMEEAGFNALAYDDEIYRNAGLSPHAIAADETLRRILLEGIQNTNGLFQNLTHTTAATATGQFERALDRVWLVINSGAMDYNSAIRSAIKELSERGIQSIRYPSGHTDYLDVAVRRAALTGVNQTALKLQLARAEEMGCDLVETTAHSGARPSHVVWQGKIFSRSGKHTIYPDFVSSTGYGTGAGLGGWNCRHNFYPFFEGFSTQNYTSGELEQINAATVKYNGEQLTEYEASQQQRHIERQLRRWKRENAAMRAAGQDATGSAAKIRDWQKTQKSFIEQTGLKRQHERERIAVKANKE